jgi:hypothetical protein
MGFDLVTPLVEERVLELAAKIEERGGGGAVEGRAEREWAAAVIGVGLHGAS